MGGWGRPWKPLSELLLFLSIYLPTFRPMEQLIPILIFAAIFGYQAYTNYQNEQEKARKRNPGQRPPGQPEVYEEVEVLEEWQQPEPVSDYYREVPANAPYPELQTNPSYDEYSGFMGQEEISRVRKASRSNQQDLLKPLEVSDEGDDIHGDEYGLREFDLRDAVIKATILERPYQ